LHRPPDPGRSKSEKTISMWRLRRILRLTIVLRRLGFLSAGPAHSHFLHALPLFGRNHHHRFRLKRIVRHPAAHHDVITGLNVRHRDALAALPQRRLFIQLDGLCHVVRPENRQLRCVNRFHFSENIVLAKHARRPSSTWTTGSRAALTCSASASSTSPCTATKPAVGPLSNHFRGPSVIRVFLATHKHHVSDLEITELRRLSLFPELRAPADLDRYNAPVLPGDFEGLVVHRRQFPHYSGTPLACAPLRLSGAPALRRAWILCRRSVLRCSRGHLKHRSEQANQ